MRAYAAVAVWCSVLISVPCWAGWTWRTLDCPGAKETWATGIDGNNIVGGCTNTSGNSYGFLYDGSTWTARQYPLVWNGSRDTAFTGISGSNIVGGCSSGGFLYNSSGWTLLDYPDPTVGHSTAARGIDGYKIVGSYMHSEWNGGGTLHGFLYNGSSWTRLDYPGSVHTQAAGISGNSIVGSFVDGITTGSRGFLYNGSSWMPLDYPGSAYTSATGVSGSRVVGEYSSDGSYKGFLYDGGVWTSLQYPGAVHTHARGVLGNTVVGSYTDSSGIAHGFILTVPEPATLTLLALGSLLLARRRQARHTSILFLLMAGMLAGRPGPASANVFDMGPGLASMETVPVGDAGNAADTRHATPGYGAVAYGYRIGKYDVTAAQYCEFLNAVARDSDPYGLYNPKMANPASMGDMEVGCGIRRSGTAGSYTYTVIKNPDFPVNFVSWGDAARFCNWLANGQGGPETTETGSYTLNGATDPATLIAVTRNAGASIVIPTEDEWYKAAYYKGGSAGAGYWLYATKSDSAPSNLLSDTGTNNANWCNGVYTDPSNYLTAVGAFEASTSAYGTYDQSGNVWQWNEAVVRYADIAYRGVRGGNFYNVGASQNLLYMQASFRSTSNPTSEYSTLGFRVALVPEPATLGLLALGGLLLAHRRQARHYSGIILLATGMLIARPDAASANVLDMGGTRDSLTGQWTGLASLETVRVGNAGNDADTTGYGRVGYGYRIGKYEVTAGQYCEFLNKVAATDPHGLYNTYMDYDATPGYWGCNIKRTGVSGSYSYSVAPDWANRPVNYVSFWDACRFANWLHNGQPSGAQDESTTEDGAYTLTAQRISNNTLTRNSSWRWAVTSEDEWYKAAYYDVAKPGGPGYWLYPTRDNSVPSNDLLTPDGGNNASFNQNGFTIDSPYYRTTVGEFESSESPYGTFDQGGNVWEWNEAVIGVSSRGLRGGAFYSDTSSSGHDLLASLRFSYSAAYEDCGFGLRVVQVPEPATLSLLALSGLLLARRGSA